MTTGVDYMGRTVVVFIGKLFPASTYPAQKVQITKSVYFSKPCTYTFYKTVHHCVYCNVVNVPYTAKHLRGGFSLNR